MAAEPVGPPIPGQQLPNERTLVALRLLGRKRRDWAGDLYAVIALTGHAGDCYAVWTLVWNEQDAAERRCYGGTYTSDFEFALADWRQRTAPA